MARRSWKRQLASGSSTVRGALQLSAQVALAATLFALLQLLATRHNVRFDLTPDKAYILATASKQVAAALSEPVHLTFFYNSQESGERREIADLLDQFRDASALIDYRLVDLDRSPGLAQRYGISSYNVGVAETEKRKVILRGSDEETITNALLRLSRHKTRTLCFITGHGEHSPASADERTGYSEIARALERETFTTRTLLTIPRDGIPADCTITILAGPTHDLLAGEVTALENSLRHGGRAMLLVDRDTPASIVNLLRRLGLEVGDDLIVDERNRFLGSDSFTVRVPVFDRGTYGNKLDAAAVFPVARSVRPAMKIPPHVHVALLAMTSRDSWALDHPGPRPDEKARFRQGTDHAGPLPVGALLTFGGKESKNGTATAAPARGRLAVFGDADFASNFYLNLLGNKDLFMSTVAVLAEEPRLIAVRRKGLTRGSLSPIVITARQGRTVFWVCVVLGPALWTLLGVMVGLRRRHRGGGR